MLVYDQQLMHNNYDWWEYHFNDNNMYFVYFGLNWIFITNVSYHKTNVCKLL